MSLNEPAFWISALLTAGATTFGVILAFTLERAVEQRRRDAAAFWMARHWAHALTRQKQDGILKIVVRGLVYGRTAPKRPSVQMALAEVDARVATWWSKATECLVEAEDSLPNSLTSRRAREWADEIDRELARAEARWPSRSRRLKTLIGSLPSPQTHSGFRLIG